VVVGLSLLARSWPIPPLAKFASVGTLACIAAFACGALLVRLPGFRRVL